MDVSFINSFYNVPIKLISGRRNNSSGLMHTDRKQAREEIMEDIASAAGGPERQLTSSSAMTPCFMPTPNRTDQSWNPAMSGAQMKSAALQAQLE